MKKTLLAAYLAVVCHPPIALADTPYTAKPKIYDIVLGVDKQGRISVNVGSNLDTKESVRPIEKAIKACAERAQSHGESIVGTLAIESVVSNLSRSYALRSSTFGDKTLLIPCIEARIKILGALGSSK